MLENVDLSIRLDKQTYKNVIPLLSARLYEVQKASWDARLPIVIIFEGWDAAGKGTSIQRLTESLDPRGFKLYPIRAARTYEKKHPWLWRFWSKLPARGEWAIFDRSWYGRVMVERVENLVPETEWRRGYRDIVDFERTIADDGTLILKFFMHISKYEQKSRFEKLIKDPLSAWHVTNEDWDHHRHYDEWFTAYEEALENTDTEWGSWTIVEATDRRHSRVKIFTRIIRALEERLNLPPLNLSSPDTGDTETESDDFEETSTDITNDMASGVNKETLIEGVISDLLEEDTSRTDQSVDESVRQGDQED